MRSSLRQIARQQQGVRRGRSSFASSFDTIDNNNANPLCFCRSGTSRTTSTTSISSSSSRRNNRSQSPVRGARTLLQLETSTSSISKNCFYNPNNNNSNSAGQSSKYRWLSTVVETDPSTNSSNNNDSNNNDSSSNNDSISTDQLLQNAGIDRAYLEDLASQHPTPLRLKDMYHLGSSPDQDQRLRNAQFLHQELPVRMAQRAMDLLTLPHGLSAAPPIQQVAAIYLQFLKKFQEFPRPTTAVEEFCFTDMLQALVLDRTSIPVSIAQGVQSWWKTAQVVVEEEKDELTQDDKQERLHQMEEALYRFFTARV